MTINLKDFKAMLGLCENLGAQVRAWVGLRTGRLCGHKVQQGFMTLPAPAHAAWQGRNSPP